MPQAASQAAGPSPYQTWKDFKIIVSVLAAAIVLGVAVVAIYKWSAAGNAVLWSLACLLGGGLIGFLFGIPRVLQGNGGPIDTPAAADGDSYHLQVNTNLEQISDWLTKIIVGVGLVELRRFPEYIGGIAGFIAGGLGGSEGDRVLAAAITLYFAILGFFGGYLITRIYLAGAFSRADRESQATVEIGGNRLTVEQVSKELSNQIADLRAQFLVMANGQPAPQAKGLGMFREPPAEGVPPPDTSPVKALLWADDNPKNNGVLIDQLTKRGIIVSTAVSTAEALAAFKAQPFDRVITDLARIEDGKPAPGAGIELIKALRALDKAVPIIVYCLPQSELEFHDAAIAAGATAITSSQTLLMQALRLDG